MIVIFIIKEKVIHYGLPLYISYNKFINNQYLNVKLNDYIRQNVV